MIKTICVICAALTIAGGSLSSKTLDWYAHYPQKGGLPAVMPEAAGFFEQSDAIFMGDAADKKVYLTFDAGYENGCTARILEQLAAAGVTAAFFLDGNYLRRNPELVAQMSAQGHLVCNHTLNHPDMTKLTQLPRYREQLEKWERLCDELGVKYARLYRPPMGKFSQLSLSFDRELGYKTVFWSIAYADWDPNKQPSPEKALALLTQKAHNGAIYLLHSVSSTNAAILPQLISQLRGAGYQIAPASELLDK